ncbi:MAG: sugar transferase [Ruminococcus sp.]|nr:sugar transferase [Ruminococcus sp.]
MFYHIVKRSFDILSSLAAIILTSPVWLISIIAIKVSSKGPVFYKSYRVCRNNKPFTMYKFRSMHVFQPQKEGQRSEGSFVGNTRVFKYGSFMRKSKIDELPQLLNILLGQMSVVGPRPISKESAEKNYVGRYACISEVKPGLACFDSLFDYAHGELVVSDNNEYIQKVIPVRRELARMYVEKQSIAADVYCIFRTIELIFKIVVLKRREFPYTKNEQAAQNAVFKEEVLVTQ